MKAAKIKDRHYLHITINDIHTISTKTRNTSQDHENKICLIPPICCQQIFSYVFPLAQIFLAVFVKLNSLAFYFIFILKELQLLYYSNNNNYWGILFI